VNPERWARICRIFEAAQELEAPQQEEFVRKECATDEELCRTVLDMLAVGEAAEGFLDPRATVNEPVDELPWRLGDFELLERIGRGGMGTVYRARQLSLARDVAVKVLAPGAFLSLRVERFLREARVGAKLHHPGIVAVLSIGQEGETRYFAMDLVEGHDLAREIEELKGEERGASPSTVHLPSSRAHEYFREVARMIRDVADALAHAHRNGIVHRDVKPSNVLVQRDGAIKVVDFGLARDVALETITRSGMIAGTLPYMSPEQARSRKEAIDHRTDVYSLGVILYELLTLKRPHSGDSESELLARIASEEPVPVRRLNPRVPRDLETICAGAMEKAVKDRYATAAELRDDLTRFLGHEAVLRKPAGLGLLLLRRARRHRVGLSVLGVGTLAFLVGGWVVANAARRSRLAELTHVSVRAFDASGAPLPAVVRVRPVDPFTSGVGPAAVLGRTPLEPTPLEDGYHRIVVVFDDGAFQEIPLFADGSGDVVALEVEHRDFETEGLVAIGPETYTFPDYDSPPAYQGVILELPAFWIARTEVTNREYDAFVRATGHRDPSYWKLVEDREAFLRERGDDPVVGVTWSDAVAYCLWRGMRLPTAAEWHRAAGGAENRPFPYSADPDAPPRGNVLRPLETANDTEGRWALYLANIAPADSSPDAASPEGLLHMYGNVQEYTESAAIEPMPGRERIYRTYDRFLFGGYWSSRELGTGMRSPAFYGLDDYTWFQGFRCAKSLAP